MDEFESGGDAQHEGRGGKHPGLEAGRRDDCRLKATVGDGPARARVHDVTVAHAFDHDAAKIVAGGSDALPAGEGETAFIRAGLRWIFQSDVPRGATGGHADGAKMSAMCGSCNSSDGARFRGTK